MSSKEIRNIYREKDREKELADDRPAKLDEKKDDRELEREIRSHLMLEVCTGGEKIRNASGH